MALPARAARRPAIAPVLALLGAALVLGGPPASPAQAQACETPQRTQGAFRSVAKPTLLPGSLTAHAVEPADPRVVYLADQTSVAVSRDAGCTWELVLEIPSAPSTAISSLTVPDSPSPSGRLLVVTTTSSQPPGDESGAVSVVHSRRGDGEPFRQSAPLPGRVSPAVAAENPDVVYLSTTDQGQAALGPLRSADGGATFAPTRGTRTYPPSDGGAADGAPRHVVVDPDSSSAVLVASASLQRSADAGSSFAVVLGLPDVRYAHALAEHGPGEASGTVALAATGNATTGLADGSAEIWSVPRTGEPRSLPTAGLLGVPQSLAAGRTVDELVLTVADLPRGEADGYDGPGALYLLDAAQQRWVDVMDRRGYPLLDAQVDRSADPAVHLHSSSLSDPLGADEYVVYSPAAQGRVLPPAPGEAGAPPVAPPAEEFPAAPGACPTAPVFEPPAVRESASRLTPGQAQLTVDASGAATHRLELDLVGDAAALDLVILLDTSDSMGPAAQGIVCGLEGLVTGLAADGVDLRVGLAEFWDSAPGTRYQRLVDLAPPGRDVQRALRSVTTRGGEETHRSALVQAVTGSGLDVNGQQVVRPGQGMSLREDAVKVVLHVTDEPWTATTPGEPSAAEVVQTMAGAGVRHVGLQVLQDAPVAAVGGDQLPGPVAQRLLRAQLDDFSRGTGALAPAGGVDCNGDGAPDLREGEPLVCTGEVQGGIVPDVGPAVRSLVQALPVRGAVALRSSAAQDVQVAVQEQYDDVDLRAAGRYAFPLVLSCRPGAPGPVPVSFEALAGPVVVSTATAVVLCTSPPVAVDPPLEAAPVPPAVPDGPSAAAAAGPAGAPPPVIEVPAPAPAPAAAAGAVVGAAGSAGAGASGGATAVGSVTQAAGSGATGMAGAPGETARRTAQVGISTTGEDVALDAVPLAAVPLAAGLLSTAALTTHLLATRRRPRLPAAREHVRRR